MGNVLSFAGCANSSEELPYTAPLSRSTAISVSKHLCRVSVGVARLEPRETSPSSPTTTSFTSASSSTSSQQATTQPLADRTWTEGVVALGPSPSGSLTIRRSDKAFPNSVGEDNGIKCIELLYRVPAGIQRQYHPSPGRPHTAWTPNIAYLPDNEVGRSLLWRLKWAFSRGLTFSVGYSQSRNEDDTVVWTQAFGHKTSLQKGGPFSFPDASYFQKTGEQLDALGVPVPPREVTTPVFEVIRYLAPDQLPAPKTATTPTSSPSPLRTANSTPPRHMASPGIPDRPCALCQKRLSARSAVQLVDCKHALHLDCLSQHLHKNPCCPIQDCRSPPLVRQGTSPSGTMTSQVLGVDWIKVAYDIPPGKQLPYHPTPNARHEGFTRYAHLPNTDAGRDVLKRLQYAWLKGLLFKVTGPEQQNPNKVVSTCPALHRIFSTGQDPRASSVDAFLTKCHDWLGDLGVPEVDQCLAPRHTMDPNDTLESQLAFTAFVSHSPLPSNEPLSSNDPPLPSFNVPTTKSVVVPSPLHQPSSRPLALVQGKSAATGPPPNRFRNSILVLRSEPFVLREEGQPTQPVAKLALDREGRFFETLLKEEKRGITLYLDTATLDRFDAALALRCTILHYSGHGMSDSLPFELNGEVHAMGINVLQRMVEQKNGTACRLAFVSACKSLNVGRAFVAAGVKHVVCCDVSTSGSDSEGEPQGVTDIAAYTFSRSFYRALTGGNTVMESFQQARTFVVNSPEVRRAVRNPEEEMKKFRLLPDGSDGHDVVLFDNLNEVPQWPAEGLDLTKYFVRNAMQQDPSPSPPHPLLGRENAQFEVLNLVLNRRFVSVVGAAGIGCSSVVRGVCHYINERASTFNDSGIERIFYLKVKENETCLGLARELLRSVNPYADGLLDDFESVTGAICAALRRTPTLVVLYRIHKVSDMNAAFRSFLCCLAREVRVLVTSQSRLNVRGEEVYALAPLDYGSTARLFCTALSSSRVRFTAREIRTLMDHLDSRSVATVLPTDPNLSRVVEGRFKLMGSGAPKSIEDAAHNLSREQYQTLLRNMFWSPHDANESAVGDVHAPTA